MALRRERERGSVLGVYVSSHHKLIVTEINIAYLRSPELLTLSVGREYACMLLCA